MITVLHLNRLCIAIVICSSEKLSSALVGSSRIMILGSLRNIFAIANRCLCHPDNLIHFSHISVSSHAGKSYINSHFASLITVFIFSSIVKTPSDFVPQPPPSTREAFLLSPSWRGMSLATGGVGLGGISSA